MDAHLFALLERVHGHLALLGLAVLVHPVISLGRGGALRRGTWLSAVIGVAMLLPAFGLGLGIYPAWRTQVKPDLVQDALGLALAFEVKEHLAWFSLVSALGGVAVLGTAGGLAGGRRLGRWLLGAGVACGAVTAGLGIWIAGGVWAAW